MPNLSSVRPHFLNRTIHFIKHTTLFYAASNRFGKTRITTNPTVHLTIPPLIMNPDKQWVCISNFRSIWIRLPCQMNDLKILWLSDFQRAASWVWRQVRDFFNCRFFPVWLFFSSEHLQNFRSIGICLPCQTTFVHSIVVTCVWIWDKTADRTQVSYLGGILENCFQMLSMWNTLMLPLKTVYQFNSSLLANIYIFIAKLRNKNC